ncbi:MAG: GUN4 domain-containing protein [Drouetiella hepatica Uher 2000/2452]|jgi:serine/threonine-protein kinase|uniref:non-specific serine/threonine protein kinase n=1 Tax=Drouetiella hepatica Uher 2000/2452 TaxID=904376 RepID=A0A951UMV6_9CYAN|nr:GUN4 domain-containing protein [Drouetiella hepatica Uher 2000/2452]
MSIVGKLLRRHYKVTGVLGSGGVGETYTAVDIDRPGEPICVVKRLKSSTDPDLLPVVKTLFNREAATLEQLGHHDQIPRLLAYFDEDEEFFLVQEFIEGQPLSAELPLGHRWSEVKVIQLLNDVLTVLKFVHEQGVIHRDIKPANLIRRQHDNKLVLIDFGAVKQKIQRDSHSLEQTQIKGTISIGTEGYMPPEQQAGSPNLNSDIYALGMIGIQALTGENPAELQRDADGEILWQHRARVSDELASILNQMVRYYFKARYRSATEALNALIFLIDRYFKSTESNENASAAKIEEDLQKLADTVTATDTPAIQDISRVQETKVASGAEQNTSDIYETKVASFDAEQNDSRIQETKFADLQTNVAETKYSLDSIPVFQKEDIEASQQVAKINSSFKDQLREFFRESEAQPESNRKGLVLGLGGVVIVAITVIGFVASQMISKTLGLGVLPGDLATNQTVTASVQSDPSSPQQQDSSNQEVKPDRFQADYAKLQTALQRKDWREADQQTYKLMLKIAGSESTQKGSFALNEWQSFPCDQFRKVDELWRKASSNRLGFSTQWQIYQRVGASKYHNTIGWKTSDGVAIVQFQAPDNKTRRAKFGKGGEPNFDNPPAGHLPAMLLWSDQQGNISFDDQRLGKAKDCGL